MKTVTLHEKTEEQRMFRAYGPNGGAYMGADADGSYCVAQLDSAGEKVRDVITTDTYGGITWHFDGAPMARLAFSGFLSERDVTSKRNLIAHGSGISNKGWIVNNTRLDITGEVSASDAFGYGGIAVRSLDSDAPAIILQAGASTAVLDEYGLLRSTGIAGHNIYSLDADLLALAKLKSLDVVEPVSITASSSKEAVNINKLLMALIGD